jgi:tRNA (adenine22-N1)-methyltransferase
MQRLSKRLQAVADYVTEGNRVVDVGTDHAYIPIYLLQSGKIPSAIAADIGKGPLERAKENIAENGLTDRIDTILSDGLKKINTDYESLIIAGMGGMLLKSILEANPAKTASFQEMILEPQSDLEEVRKYLRQHGYQIREENMVLEEGKYYPIMHVFSSSDGEAEACSEEDQNSKLYDRYGFHLIQKASPVLLSYLQKEEKEKQKVMTRLEGISEKSPALEERMERLQEDLTMNRMAQKMICDRAE